MGTLVQDLRFAVRGMIRRPGMTGLALVTFGLGIGATSAIYSLVDGILLRALPYDSPGDLVQVWGLNRADGSRTGTSEADFNDYQARTRSFEAMASFEPRVSIARRTGGAAQKLFGAAYSADFLTVLRAQPALGRAFTPEEHKIRAPSVILSHELWTDLFGADPTALGSKFELDEQPFSVVGVMGPEFDFPAVSMFWTPDEARAGDATANASSDSFGRDWRLTSLLARLLAGVEVGTADEDLKRVASALESEYPLTNTNHSTQVLLLHDAIVGAARAPLIVLLGAVAMILAIACANVAGLLLSRVSDRGREVAVRAALGASRARIIRQFLTESLLLATIGGVVGVGVGEVALRFFLARAPVTLPRVATVVLDMRVVAAMILLTGAAGVLFGAAPALLASRRDVQQTLREGFGGAGGPKRHTLLNALVVGQIALSTVLVVGAGLLTASFSRLVDVDHGYRTDQTVAFQLNIGFDRYPGWDRFIDFFGRTVTAIEEVPGIESAEFVNVQPLVAGWSEWYHVEGRPDVERGSRPQASLRGISPGFFDMVGLDLMSGRSFDGADSRYGPGVVIVNETFADRVFPDGDALGNRLEKPQYWGQDFPAVHEIVGIVEDSRSDGLDVQPSPTLYFPFGQVPFGGNTLFVRTALDVAALAPLLRDAMATVDPLVPVEDLRTVDEMVSDAVAGNRFAMLLTGLFAMIALILANVGLYGVMSYRVAEQRYEIGLRQALGAEPKALMWQVLRGGLGLVVPGVVLGLMAALATSSVLETLLFGVTPADPGTYAIVVSTLLVVALIACAGPAARAVRVDPLVAMND